jgi:hypothetical protein
MKIKAVVNKTKVEIDLPGVTEAAYKAVAKLLEAQLGNENTKNREQSARPSV